MRLLLFLITLVLALHSRGQAYGVDTNMVVFLGHPDSTEIKGGIQIHNIGGQFLDMAWERTSQNLPVGWLASICDGVACRPPSVNFALFELDTVTNSHINKIWMYYYPDSISGSATTTLTLWSVDEPNDTLTLYFECTASLSMGVNDIQRQQLLIYPNPAHSVISVSRSSNDTRNWEIFDMQGRSILNGTFGSLKQEISISGLRHGNYVLRSAGLTHPFVKE